MNASELKIKFIDSIHQCARADWQACLASQQIDYPFIQYDFLAALEDSNSCCEHTGWQPQHCLAYIADQLVALMPCYLKTHSYGEYVFDHQWANAYYQHRLDYYPKLLTAIPFTPCAGPRYVVHADADQQALEQAILSAIQHLCEQQQLSGWHGLFIESQHWQADLPRRLGVQFHWYNRDYQSFDDFLASFSSRKRKNVKKERAQVAAQGIQCRFFAGAEVTEALWRQFAQLYQLTYAKRSGHQGYLTADFFLKLGANANQQLILLVAERDGESGPELCAASLFFKDRHTLYGRYWGCYQEFDFLHFEACYYQAIEYCIAHKLQHIDAGAQGEHKIQRGFQPVFTESLHYLHHPGFHQAIAQFTRDEKPHIEAYYQQCQAALPFKQ